MNAHPHKDEMIKRLYEEINEAVGTCVFGHFSRLVNSLGGFECGFDLQLEEYEADKARVFHQLNKRLNIVDIDTFEHQIETIVNSQDFEQYMPKSFSNTVSILADYTKTEWMIYNNKIKPRNSVKKV
jgi:hypothetical protein